MVRRTGLKIWLLLPGGLGRMPTRIETHLADEAKQKFATERTARFRLGELSRIDENTISNIEEFGCSIVHVSPRACAPPGEPRWAYTIGIFDTCRRPEVITVGLYQSTARYLLNEAARLLRDGVDLTNGRQKGLLETVDCEFRTVDPKWIPKVMGWAKWFYDATEFPILQAIYPDLENRFPWEPGFNERFQQPMLQKDAAFGDLERRFWEGSVDPKIGWKFPDDPHRKVFLSEAVGGGDEPITYVSHDADDGAWQFLGDSMAGDSGPVLQCLHQVVELDPSLIELADLPLGWLAEREKPGAAWVRQLHEPEEAEE